MKPTPIALMTDFGLMDPYVGIMKGVIQDIQILTGNQTLPLAVTFSSVQPGAGAGLIGSAGLLETISNQSSAEVEL